MSTAAVTGTSLNDHIATARVGGAGLATNNQIRTGTAAMCRSAKRERIVITNIDPVRSGQQKRRRDRCTGVDR